MTRVLSFFETYHERQDYLMNNSKHGYSLIELIIVIVILSILTLIAIPSFSRYRNKATLAIDSSNCRVIYYAALASSVSGGSITAGNPSNDLKILLDRSEVPKPIAGAANFVIVLDSDGNISSVNNGGSGDSFVSFP